MNKRTKLILAITIGGIIILSGTLFGLAKTGVIHIAMLADELPAPKGSIGVTVLKSSTDVTIQAGKTVQITPASASNPSSKVTDAGGFASFPEITSKTPFSISVVGSNCKPTTFADGILPNSGNPLTLYTDCSGDNNGSDDNQPTTYGIHGKVVDQADQKVLQGVRVFVGSNSTITDAFGNYTLNNLDHKIASSTNISFNIKGYESDKSKEVSVLSLKTPLETGKVNKAINVELIKNKETLLIDVQGTVKDEKGYAAEIDVEVDCPKEPEIEKRDCESKSKNDGHTSSKSSPSRTHGSDQNFLIPNLYNLAQTDSKFSKYQLTINLHGMYSVQTPVPVGTLNEGGMHLAWFDLKNTDVSQDSSDAPFIKIDIVLKKNYISIYGTVKDTLGNYIPNVKVDVMKTLTDSPLSGESSSSNLKGQNDIDEDYNYLIKFPSPKYTDSYYYKLSNLPPGYIWDENNDGLADEYVRGTVNDSSQAYVQKSTRNFVIRKADLKVETFTLFGSAKNSDEVLYSQGKIILEVNGNDFSTIELPVTNINRHEDPTVNYEIKGIPLTVGATYIARFRSIGFVMGEDILLHEFSSSDITRGLIRRDFITFNQGNGYKSISFYRSNGTPITTAEMKAKMAQVSVNKVNCPPLNSFKEYEECQSEAPEIDNTKAVATFKYRFYRDPNNTRINLFFESPLGYYGGGQLSADNQPANVYLLDHDVPLKDRIECFNLGADYGKVKFCYNKERWASYKFFDTPENVLKKYYPIFKKYFSYNNAGNIFQDSDDKYYMIYLTDEPGLGDGGFSFDPSIRYEEWKKTLDGVPFYFNARYLNDFRAGTEVILKAAAPRISSAKSENYDTYSTRSKAEKILKEQCQALNALTTPPLCSTLASGDENTFLQYFILHNGQIKSILENPKGLDTKCVNALKFLYAYMSDNFRDMVLFEPKPAKVSLTNSSQQFSKVLGASTDGSAEFIASMNEAGYEEVPWLTIDSVAPVANLNLTPDQITSGVWLKENYQTLPVNQKAKLQLSILASKAKALFTTSKPVVAIQSALDNINKQTETWLKQLGFKITSTKISGIVKDQNGPISGLMVKYSNKTAVTDQNGRYTLNRVRSGVDLLLQVSDPKIDKTFNSNPKTLTLNNDQKIDPWNIYIQRNVYRLKGQVMQGNNPLRNGKIIINSNTTLELDKDGKFDRKFKEGQYTFSIKNKNGKTVQVTNSGGYPNLPKVNVTANIDGTIWVK